jgi:hypothetical protein
MNNSMKYPSSKKFDNNNEVDFCSKYTWIIKNKNYALALKDNISNYTVNWSVFPESHKDILTGMAMLSLNCKHAKVTIEFYNCLKYIYEFLRLMHQENTLFYRFSETEWGSFIKWLSMQRGVKYDTLSLSTCRGYLSAVKSVLKVAEENSYLDITEDDIDALSGVMKRKFRDANNLMLEKNNERALTEEETDNLYKIVKEEWMGWKSNPKPKEAREQDLLAIVSTWMAFDEGIRAEEINAMTVDDVYNPADTRILIHAPNKLEDLVLFHDITMEMIRELVEVGEHLRKALNTSRLFVDTKNSTVVGTRELDIRIRAMIEKYSDKYPIKKKDIIISDGRKTLGSTIATLTDNKEKVKRVLRHRITDTAEKYYVRQRKEQTSKNIFNSLGDYAKKIADVYNSVVINPEKEIKNFEQIQRCNPEYDKKYGICTENTLKEGKCKKSHCGNCPKLIVVASKRKNWVLERDTFIKLSEDSNGTLSEQRLKHAQMCQTYIDLIDRRLKLANG